MKNKIIFLIGIGLIFGCAHRETRETVTDLRPTDTFKVSKVEPEARSFFALAEKSFVNKNFDQALKTYQLIRAKYPRGKAAQLSAYRLGMIHYYKEEYTLATKEFEAFLAQFPNSPLAFDVTYNLAACQYQQNQYEKAYQTLSRLKLSEIQAQGARRAEIVYQLAALTSVQLGNHTGAVAAYAAQLQLPLKEPARSSVEASIDKHLWSIRDKSDLERLMNDVTDPETRAKISQRLAAISPTEATAPPVAAVSIPSAAASLAIENEISPSANLGSGSSGDRLHIGVILPLSGKWAPYGKRALEGILLAAKVYQNGRDNEFELFVEDSNSNAVSAGKAVDELFYQHKVMAILGPLHWKEAVAVANRAQQLGVLNLSLSAKEGISEKGRTYFKML